MEGSKTLILLFKITWARERISLKFIDNLGTRPHKGSPALLKEVNFLLELCRFLEKCLYIYNRIN
jgi:hypothetical protein